LKSVNSTPFKHEALANFAVAFRFQKESKTLSSVVGMQVLTKVKIHFSETFPTQFALFTPFKRLHPLTEVSLGLCTRTL